MSSEITGTPHDAGVTPATSAEVNDAAQTVAHAATEATWLQTRAILRVVFIVLAVAAGLWLLYALEGVILVVVLSIFFAYLISPLVTLVRRPFKLRGGERALPRPLAIGIVYLLIFGSLGIALYILIPLLGNQFEQFTKQRSVYLDVIQNQTPQSIDRVTSRLGLPAAARDAIRNNAPRLIETAQAYSGEAATTVVGWLAHLPYMVLIPILAFFLLKDADGFRRSALQMLPRGRLRWRGDEFFDDVNSTLAAYIRAQLTACLLIGVICTAGFWLLDVPYWLPLGIVAGILEFIPLAGPLTVMVLAGVAAGFYSSSTALWVIVFLIVLRIVHDYVIYPRIIGSGIHLHPLAVVLAILCGEELAGLAGIFLAIPAVAIISVTYRHWLEHRGSTGLVADLLKPAEQAVAAPATGETAPVAPAPNTPPQTPASQTEALPIGAPSR